MLVRLAKKAMALPIPVDRPANNVRRKAVNTGRGMAMKDWELVYQKRAKYGYVSKNRPNHLQRMARPAGGMAWFGDKAFHSRGN